MKALVKNFALDLALAGTKLNNFQSMLSINKDAFFLEIWIVNYLMSTIEFSNIILIMQ